MSEVTLHILQEGKHVCGSSDPRACSTSVLGMVTCRACLILAFSKPIPFEQHVPFEQHGTVEHFRRVLDDAFAQVAPGGKGEERHGHGAPLREQPWRSIANEVRNGGAFLVGQARKKLTEATHMDDHARRRREMLGAVAYTVFAIMHDDEQQK